MLQRPTTGALGTATMVLTDMATSTRWMREFPVGDRYRCTLVVDIAPGGAPVVVRVAWEPDRPRDLTDFEFDEYRRGRDACLTAFGLECGYAIAVMDA